MIAHVPMSTNPDKTSPQGISQQTRSTRARITEPLAPVTPAPVDPFTLTVDVVSNEQDGILQVETVRVPGVLVHQGQGDPEFVRGVYWGRECMHSDIYRFFDEQGHERGCWTTAELPSSRKVRELTIPDVLTSLAETVQAAPLEDEPFSDAWQAGYIVGYILGIAEEATLPLQAYTTTTSLRLGMEADKKIVTLSTPGLILEGGDPDVLDGLYWGSRTYLDRPRPRSIDEMITFVLTELGTALESNDPILWSCACGLVLGFVSTMARVHQETCA